MINAEQIFGKTALDSFKLISCPQCGIIGREIDFIRSRSSKPNKNACPICNIVSLDNAASKHHLQ